MGRPAILSIRLTADTQTAVSDIQRAAGELDSLGAAAERASKPLLLVGSAAVLGTALAPVASAAATAGTALGAFALAAVPQLAAVAQAATTYATAQQQAADGDKQAAATMAQYRAQLAAMPPATRATAVAYGQLKTAFTAWSNSLSPTVMPLFTKGIQGLTAALPALTPLVRVAASAVAPFVDEFDQAAKSGAITRLTTQVAQFAGPVLLNGITAVRNFAAALGITLLGLGPSADRFAASLATISTRVEQLAQGSAGSGGLDKFGQSATSAEHTVANLAAAALTLVTDLGPLMGATTLVANGFAALIRATPAPVLQVLGPLVIGLGAAHKVLAIVTGATTAATALWSIATGAASVVVNTATDAAVGTRVALLALAVQEGVTTAATSLWGTVTGTATIAANAASDAAIGTRIAILALAVQEGVTTVATEAWTAAQWLLNVALDANPIGLVVVAIAALVAGVILAYQHCTTFRDICNDMWSVLTKVAGIIAGQVVSAFRTAQSVVSTVSSAVQSVVGWFDRIQVPSAIGAIGDAFRSVGSEIDSVIGKVGSLISSLGKIGGSILGKVTGGLLSAPQTARGLLAGPAAPRLRQRAMNLTSNIGVTVVIDGQQLQGRITRTVNRAMDRDGARLAAGGWA